MPYALNLWRQQPGKEPELVWRHTEHQVLMLADDRLTKLPTGIVRPHRPATPDPGHHHLDHMIRTVPGPTS
ncbi:hypothetical protein OG588_22020 [Streptomyces prunicolor]|uniref:hypothetical protein n=1 Tax=Streptomyces prunicolor TaxID=67348 RepID=UPI0038707B65|nr:hypothetical protein OG588_22020 [Streptomyces prunicolor]